LLLQRGANVNARNKYQWTPLHNATTGGKTETCILLLQASAVVDAKNYVDWTPLHYAAQNGFIETCSVLLQYGAQINEKSKHRDYPGWTPLHAAASQGRHEVCKFLLENGAETEKNQYGVAPATLAADIGFSSKGIVRIPNIRTTQSPLPTVTTQVLSIQNKFQVSNSSRNQDFSSFEYSQSEMNPDSIKYLSIHTRNQITFELKKKKFLDPIGKNLQKICNNF